MENTGSLDEVTLENIYKNLVRLEYIILTVVKVVIKG